MRLTIVFFLFFSYTAISQVDSLKVDTINEHSYKRAMIYSACLPGFGQVYNQHWAHKYNVKWNKAYWKVPLIYAGIGSTAYFIITNNSKRKAYREEYEYREETGLINSFPAFDNSALIVLSNQHRTWRDFSFLGLGVVYVLNVVDAAVEAHFVKFDISEDLSMRFSPSFSPDYGLGARISLKIR